MPVSRNTVTRLIEECKFMRARVDAILECDSAIDSLVAEDVFGGRFRALLISDRRSLTDAINAGEREIGGTVTIPN